WSQNLWISRIAGQKVAGPCGGGERSRGHGPQLCGQYARAALGVDAFVDAPCDRGARGSEGHRAGFGAPLSFGASVSPLFENEWSRDESWPEVSGNDDTVGCQTSRVKCPDIQAPLVVLCNGAGVGDQGSSARRHRASRDPRASANVEIRRAII